MGEFTSQRESSSFFQCLRSLQLGGGPRPWTQQAFCSPDLDEWLKPGTWGQQNLSWAPASAPDNRLITPSPSSIIHASFSTGSLPSAGKLIFHPPYKKQTSSPDLSPLLTPLFPSFSSQFPQNRVHAHPLQFLSSCSFLKPRGFYFPCFPTTALAESAPKTPIARQSSVLTFLLHQQHLTEQLRQGTVCFHLPWLVAIAMTGVKRFTLR